MKKKPSIIKEFEKIIEDENDANITAERLLVLKFLKDRQEKHKEESKKIAEMQKLNLKTEQEKINFLLEKKTKETKIYLERKAISAKYKSKYETEKLKNQINKVDDFLKKIENEEKIQILKKLAEKEIEEENKKSKMKPQQLCEMISRLYQLNPKDEK